MMNFTQQQQQEQQQRKEKEKEKEKEEEADEAERKDRDGERRDREGDEEREGEGKGEAYEGRRNGKTNGNGNDSSDNSTIDADADADAKAKSSANTSTSTSTSIKANTNTNSDTDANTNANGNAASASNSLNNAQSARGRRGSSTEPPTTPGFEGQSSKLGGRVQNGRLFTPGGGNVQRGESLLVRLDQPIEGMECKIHMLLRGADGAIVSPSSRDTRCTWWKSATKRICANPTCQDSRKIAIIQDLFTLRRYCGYKCFKACFQRGLPRHPSTIVPDCPGRIEEDPDAKYQLVEAEKFEEDDEWVVVSNEMQYTPSKEDVGHAIRLECTALDGEGNRTIRAQAEQHPIVIPLPPPAPPRRMIHSPDYGNNTESVPPATTPPFRVVTYNILAEMYATKKMFPYCPRWALDWSYRRVRLIRELEDFNADVICLQEAQRDHFESYILPILQKKGYAGVFKGKTRDSMRNNIDGCAILYKESIFKQHEMYGIEFDNVARELARQGAFPFADAALKRLCRGNVAQALVLEYRTPGMVSSRFFVVANCHIFWDPDFPDVKLWQTGMLLNKLEGLVTSCKVAQSLQAKLPLVLCGDFNSMPDSSVVQLIAEQALSQDHPDLAADQEGVLPDLSLLTHSLSLSSSFQAVVGHEPKFTNYTQHYTGVLDYAWFSHDTLEAVTVMQIPDEEQLRIQDDTHLPNSVYPSDHLPICADLRFIF